MKLRSKPAGRVVVNWVVKSGHYNTFEAIVRERSSRVDRLSLCYWELSFTFPKQLDTGERELNRALRFCNHRSRANSLLYFNNINGRYATAGSLTLKEC